MERYTRYFLLVTMLFASLAVTAELSQEQREFEQDATRLDRLDFLPSLLPVIIDNSDVIELTDEQVDKLLEWRMQHREDILAAMNEIVSKRTAIRQAALSPTVSAARIEQMQTEIFRLQRAVLDYKLSCRDLVIDTFNQANWDGFFFVLAEQGIEVELPELMATRQAGN